MIAFSDATKLETELSNLVKSGATVSDVLRVVLLICKSSRDIRIEPIPGKERFEQWRDIHDALEDAVSVCVKQGS